MTEIGDWHTGVGNYKKDFDINIDEHVIGIKAFTFIQGDISHGYPLNVQFMIAKTYLL